MAVLLLAASWLGTLLAAEPWTLERALDQALKASPDAEIARQRMAATQAGLAQADAAFRPRLQFQSSYLRTDNPMLVFGSILNQRVYSPTLDFNDVPDVDNFNAKGMLTLPLYTGGRNTANRSAARANAGAAREENLAVRNAIGFEVSRAFHTVLKAREFVRATEAAVRGLEQSVEVGKKRLEAGTALKTEVLDLEVRLAEARENLAQARNAQSLATRSLSNLLGFEGTEGEFVVAESAPTVSAPDSKDYSRRPELAAAGLRSKAAGEQVRAARGDFLPRVSAFGSLDYDYGWKYENGGGSYSAGALLQWDLVDGSLRRSKVREAAANHEAARAEERKIRLAIDLEAEQARLALSSANERLAVTAKAIAQAEESLALTRSRFEQGQALSVQLIDAETALVGARVRGAEAKADREIAIAALRKALGLPLLGSGGAPETSNVSKP